MKAVSLFTTAAAGAAVFVAAHTTAPGSASQDHDQTRWFRYLMGTSVRVEAYGGTPDERRAAAEENK